ncbi:MAG: hypothetical protein R6U64_03845, partial [Bacteroidales bacterium]
MRITVITSLIFLIMLSHHSPAYCQQTPDTQASEQDTLIWRVETIDGNVFTGHILSRNDQQIVLQTENFGQLKIQSNNIKSMNLVQPDDGQGEDQMDEIRATSRYFWAPSGYNLEEGEGYYQNVWVLFNQVSYGITDRFTIGAGMIPLFLFAGAPTPLWVTAKMSIPVVKDHFNLGAGVLAAGIIGEGTGVGIAFGNGTLGTRDRNVSLGLGWGFSGEGMSSIPVINFSTMVRYSRRSYFISENYFIDQELIFSAGGRTSFQKINLDYGLIIPVTGGEFFA